MGCFGGIQKGGKEVGRKHLLYRSLWSVNYVVICFITKLVSYWEDEGGSEKLAITWFAPSFQHLSKLRHFCFVFPECIASD